MLAKKTAASGTNPAVVLGLSSNGLGLVRSLHAAGVQVIGIDRHSGIWDTHRWMSSHTRLCDKIFYADTDTEGLLSCLLDLGRRLNSPGILFPSGDAELLCISRNRAVLAEHFRFRVPDSSTVELLADKARFHEFAVAHGVAAPVTFTTPTPDNIDEIAAAMPYPALIKPHFRDSSWNQAFASRKVLVAPHRASLVEQFMEVYKDHRNLLIQEIVPGPDSSLYFSHAYLTESLRPAALWTGRKIRQRPIHFGTSTMTETVWVDAIASDSLKILQALSCVGYSSIEFKHDARDGKFKIMEVTQGRTWYPHFLGFGAGVNIPHIWYRDLLGQALSEAPQPKNGVRWIDECQDLAASIDYWRVGELTIWNWLRSYKRVSVFAYSSLKDPLPVFLVVIRLLLEIPRGIFRRATFWLGSKKQPVTD